MTQVAIHGGGTGADAGVSDIGELITRGFDHSDPTIKQLTDTTVTNVILSRSGEQFIMTGMYASADRSIANAGELLQIYEASTSLSGTQDKLLFSVDLARQADAGPNFPTTRITQGKFINIDRTGTAGVITVTLWGYFIPVLT